ncbi:ABC1 kinase family protein [Marinimicrococcus flavescens]|uniref:AarF/ABC1/UbiB kinase family protein n=1 Tax=Marinimicrococcus flavescens TaxID=3031815 RepID=A0AAP3XR96_9PROT|nr:AarF/ABC1/UbiB kinase family protein [Marinimicrococcus flavescens]
MSDIPDRRTEPASENSLGGRVRRYARVGGTVAGQAARIAGNRFLGGAFDRGRHAGELREALGGLKGPLMKVAQLMATIPDALPAEYAAELAQLQSQAPPMGKPFVRRRMASELGPDWQRHFAEFPLEASNAASLGQVHKARLGDGRLVACKLQYPGMESAVEADLAQLRVIFSLYRRWDAAIDPSRIYEEIAARLREELDYSREARHMALYGEMLAQQPRVHVPGVVGELSTHRLLVMDWLEGRPLLSFKEAPQEVRNELALNMFHAWYRPFYGYGVIHGDPHLGNYTADAGLDVNLLDFGCIRVFPPRFVKGVIDLYWALARGDRDLAVSAYETWGFTGLSHEVLDILNEWAAFLYAPLMENKPRLIQDGATGREGRQVAERVHQRLREAGGVMPPREFVFMDRAAVGLGSVFMHLAAEVNWHELFMGLIEGFDVDVLAERQRAALERHRLEAPA